MCFEIPVENSLPVPTPVLWAGGVEGESSPKFCQHVYCRMDSTM